MTRLIFLRHVQTANDPSANAAEWGLSTDGHAQAAALAEHPLLQRIHHIYVSSEQKTAETVAPLAKKLGMTPIVHPAFDEVRRGDAFLSPEDFALEKGKQLTDLDYPAFGGETARNALERFRLGIDEVVARHPHETVLIASHGTVLNLYFASLLGAESELPDRWQRTPFGAIGIVEGASVVRDITAPLR